MRNLAAAAALLLSVAFAPSTLALDSADWAEAQPGTAQTLYPALRDN